MSPWFFGCENAKDLDASNCESIDSCDECKPTPTPTPTPTCKCYSRTDCGETIKYGFHCNSNPITDGLNRCGKGQSITCTELHLVNDSLCNPGSTLGLNVASCNPVSDCEAENCKKPTPTPTPTPTCTCYRETLCDDSTQSVSVCNRSNPPSGVFAIGSGQDLICIKNTSIIPCSSNLQSRNYSEARSVASCQDQDCDKPTPTPTPTPSCKCYQRVKCLPGGGLSLPTDPGGYSYWEVCDGSKPPASGHYAYNSTCYESTLVDHISYCTSGDVNSGSFSGVTEVSGCDDEECDFSTPTPTCLDCANETCIGKIDLSLIHI